MWVRGIVFGKMNQIINTYCSTAYDVNLDDTAAWPSDKFDLTSGLITAQWDKIPAYVHLET